jgi:two-component system phosphate regulon sensor histidine kinase PhoR
MFWRLFLTYLLLVVTAIGLVGVVIYKRAEHIFFDLANDVAVTVVLVVIAAVAAAFALARRFARPFDELTDGARRLAEGDFGHKIRVYGGHQHSELAETFNAMSSRLAAMFDLLEHDKEQLRAILSGMVEGVIAIDVDQRVLFANDRAGALLGFDPNAAVKRQLCDLTHQQAFRDIVGRALSGTEPCREELEWKGPPARILALYISRFPGHGTPGAVVVIHDTTDLRKVERLRQDFVANVSHELKTPLAVIKSSVEALADGAAEEPDARNMFLTQVVREADRLEELISDLLSLARIESGNLGLEPQAIALGRAITDCMERHQARAEIKTLTLVERPPPDQPGDVSAWVDADALRQVMDNLVDNAIKYTPNGGRISVRWTARGDTVSFEVADSGLGIPEADLPRIFERFYRVDKARSRAVGGTGLGLAIVKHLVQAMKGQVTVTSKVGKGTTFRVTLPRAGAA